MGSAVEPKLGWRRCVALMWMVWARSFRESPWTTVVSACEGIGKVASALQPLCYGWMVTSIINQQLAWFVAAVVVLVVSISLNQVLQMVGTIARLRQRERVGHSFDAEIAELSAQIPTLDHLESSVYLDKLQALRNNANALGDSLDSTISFLNNLAWAVAAVGVAATADPRMLLLVIVGVLPLLVQPMQLRWSRAVEEAEASPSRLTRALLSMTSQTSAGAEIRIFGLGPVLLRRLAQATEEWRTPATRLATRRGLLDLGLKVLYFSSALAIVGWILVDTLAGRVAPGNFTTAVTSLAAMQSLAGTLVLWIGIAGRSVRAADRYMWLRQYSMSVQSRSVDDPTVPKRLDRGIELTNVGFRYPGSTVDVLAGVTLQLPAGSVVAVVGENGAGKTTLVKLLTGMYEPTDGTVRVDGAKPSHFDPERWRAHLSGAFQDHVQLELTVQHAVGSGDLTRLDDPAAVESALGRSGMDGTWPDGLRTQLGTSWRGGVELSGGQWQRVALARAMMRSSPLLLVLDEPTSALDATAEHELFERHAAAARGASSVGGITLLVTHRFSTVAAADLVIVLDQGRVSEVGTHRQLMAAGGTYADLYRIQAAGYSD